MLPVKALHYTDAQGPVSMKLGPLGLPKNRKPYGASRAVDCQSAVDFPNYLLAGNRRLTVYGTPFTEWASAGHVPWTVSLRLISQTTCWQETVG